MGTRLCGLLPVVGGSHLAVIWRLTDVVTPNEPKSIPESALLHIDPDNPPAPGQLRLLAIGDTEGTPTVFEYGGYLRDSTLDRIRHLRAAQESPRD